MYKICEWNVNFAATKQTINDFLREELLRLETDILCLTEFVFEGNEEILIDIAEKKNWAFLAQCNYTAEDPQNDVLICWNRDRFDVVTDYTAENLENRTTASNSLPNVLAIVLRDKATGIEFLLLGVRIILGPDEQKVAEWNRRKQLAGILNAVRFFKGPVLIMGDFNNYRRGYKSKFEHPYDYESFVGLTARAWLNLYIPEGSSIYKAQNWYRLEFPQDRFLTRGCRIRHVRYERSFTSRNPQVYTNGEDFSIYDSVNKRTVWQVPIGSGYPDHAMLLGELCFD